MAVRATLSSSFIYGWTYDVFLSFQGEDTRSGFISYLSYALDEEGIRTFTHAEEVEVEEEEQITPSLFKAIEESRIAIPVFSKNYASSSFCLDELCKILECDNGKGRLVLPVFYHVDPSEVRYQTGIYGEALAKHEQRVKAKTEKLQKWREALHQAANLSGWHVTHGGGYEYEFVERIVQEVSRKIKRVALPVAAYPVGLESRVLKVNSLLDVGSDDGVRMVGIYGMGGIGKTTIAQAVYNLTADHFDGLCFLYNVREDSIRHGLVRLQEKLLSKIAGEKDIMLASVNEGISIIKQRLNWKKVLLILDDVDKLEQLQAMAGRPDWFGSGSRVIITTRDKRLLEIHGVERTYEVEELNENEALELLCWSAFKSNKVNPSYVDLLKRAVAYASGLPLALKVIGSNLYGRNIEEWKHALAFYNRIPNIEIYKILKASFDALEDFEREIFLDIACFFNGCTLAYIEGILCAHYGDCPKYRIAVLVEKSLIKINEDGRVTLHDLIEGMGKEIVRQESPKMPGRRSRLWLPEDIVQVLEDDTGTNNIEIINLDFPKFGEVKWDGKGFKKMKNLKTLIIRNGRFSEGPKHLPNSLRVLEWWGYPSRSLPSDFCPKELAIFKLPHSCLMSLDLHDSLKKFVNLRVLNVDYCECITEIPDLSGVPNLEELSFQDCENLIKIHNSVGFLDRLRILDAKGCSKLKTFPPIKLTSLERLDISFCSSLESFPEILGIMENITELELCWSPIKELPFSIRNLTRLRRLELHSCGVFQLPSSIVMLPELEELSVWQCEGLQSAKQDEGEEEVSLMVSSNVKHLHFMDCNVSDEFLRIGLAWFVNVKELDLSSNNFTFLPASIKECYSLRKLNLDYCVRLQEIKGIPPNLDKFSAKRCTSLKDLDLTVLPACTKECRFLRELILDDCENLREIRGLPPNLELLSARNCTSLTSSCTSMLLNQELHKAGNKIFCLPGRRIPEWFEHRCRGASISFWFRNKFPAFSLCLVGLVHKHPAGFTPIVIINGNKMKTEFHTQEWCYFEFPVVTEHILIFGNRQIKFEDNVDEVLLENEWNHVLVSIDIHLKRSPPELFVMQTGLHVFKQKSSMEDIRFTGPYNDLFPEENNRLVDMGVSQRQIVQQQKNLASLALLEPHIGQGRELLSLLPPPALKSLTDNVNWDSNSMVSSQISSTASVQGLQEEQHLSAVIQQNFEVYKSVNEAKGKGMVGCNDTDGEDDGRIPFMELLPMAKEYQVNSNEYQPASNDKTLAWDPMEMEYQMTYSDKGCHAMGSD